MNSRSPNLVIGAFNKAVLLGQITLHSVSNIIHLNLASRELINPWKLGGYGMYTTAQPSPVVFVFDGGFDAVPITMIEDDQISTDTRQQVFHVSVPTHNRRVFANLSRNSPKFRDICMRFVVTEQKCLRDPIRTERHPHAVLEIRWTAQTTFGYAGKLYGKLFRSETGFKPCQLLQLL